MILLQPERHDPGAGAGASVVAGRIRTGSHLIAEVHAGQLPRYQEKRSGAVDPHHGGARYRRALDAAVGPDEDAAR
jgi:hypothetical protein